MSNYYLHKYGGLYKIININDNIIYYEHTYPFEYKSYVRNKKEFFESFKSIPDHYAKRIIDMDGKLLREQITQNKELKRIVF